MEQNPKVGIAKAKYSMPYAENIVAALENIPFVLYNSKDGMLNSMLRGAGGSICRVNVVRQVGAFDNRLSGVGED